MESRIHPVRANCMLLDPPVPSLLCRADQNRPLPCPPSPHLLRASSQSVFERTFKGRGPLVASIHKTIPAPSWTLLVTSEMRPVPNLFLRSFLCHPRSPLSIFSRRIQRTPIHTGFRANDFQPFNSVLGFIRAKHTKAHRIL